MDITLRPEGQESRDAFFCSADSCPRNACFECAPPAVVASGGDENAIKREANLTEILTTVLF